MALQSLSLFVDSTFGVIERVDLLPLDLSAPEVACAVSFPNRRYADEGRIPSLIGVGAGLTQEQACAKAMGETLERYAASLSYADIIERTPQKKLDSLGRRSLLWPSFDAATVQRDDYPFAKPTVEAPMNWAPTRALIDGQHVYVPANYVYLHRTDRAGSGFIADWPISTGLALWTTYHGAIQKALLEVIERDSFMLTWLLQIPPREILLSQLNDPRLQRLVSSFSSDRFSVRAFQLWSDLPAAVILVLVESRYGLPPYSVAGLGAGLSTSAALHSALEEAALGVACVFHNAALDPDFEPDADFGNVTTLQRHYLLHAFFPAVGRSLDFIRDTESKVEIADADAGRVPIDLPGLIHELSRQGHLALWRDLTSPDLASAGLFAVRVLVPSLQPLDVDVRWRHLGTSRLQSVRARYGDRLGGDLQLNKMPHPFP